MLAFRSPCSGEVNLCNHVLSSMNNHQLAEIRGHLVGFIFQFHHLLYEFNVYENVAMSARLAGVKDDLIEEWVKEALSDVNLSASLWYSSCQQLSGGERQRVACARAVVHRPRLILADEPTGCLDAFSSSQMIQFILDYQNKHGSGLILVTHDPKGASMLSRHFKLDSGRMKEQVRSEV